MEKVPTGCTCANTEPSLRRTATCPNIPMYGWTNAGVPSGDIRRKVRFDSHVIEKPPGNLLLCFANDCSRATCHESSMSGATARFVALGNAAVDEQITSERPAVFHSAR